MTTVRIANLYPLLLSIYGDHGNLRVLQQRLGWYGHDSVVVDVPPEAPFPSAVDLLFIGGGTDHGQAIAAADLTRIADRLRAFVAGGTPALAICGGYQLFGNSFSTNAGERIDGIGIFEATTHAAPGRLVGNAVVDTDDFGQIVGFENHSGRTILGTTAPLGRVRRGHGNNGHDRTEGARHFNAIGTYLHGPILAKNPQIADFLITRTLERRLGTPVSLPHLDDSLEHAAARHGRP